MRTFLISFIALLIIQAAAAQGCVAIRGIGGLCNMPQHGETAKEQTSKWSLNIDNRYFRSFRHFVGTEEQKERVEKGTEVINHSYALNIGITRQLDDRWSLSMNVPYLSNVRSSLYEHGGKARYSTHSVGLGDIRVSAGYWLVNPASHPKGNIQTALGIKFATGDYKYQDAFHLTDSTTILGPVDQSIQLGDGGTGFSTEVNAFYNFSEKLSAYGNFYYLFNPREQNGVSTARGGTISATALAYGTAYMSVPDQLMARAGFNYTAKAFTGSVGIREECLPSKDVIGGSSGFRRPGYVISIEPGVSYQFKKVGIYAFVPVVIKRDRTQSYGDKVKTRITKVYSQGDAAFADYLVNIGATFRF